jgi:archaellum biogenesis ATPase FlaH
MSVEIERAFLGAVLTEPTAWGRAKSINKLCASDFLIKAHQQIFARLERMANADEPLDLPTLAAAMESHELESIGGAAYLAELLDGTVPENVLHYARKVREQRRGRDFEHLSEQLEKAKTPELRLEILDAMRETLQREDDGRTIRTFGSILGVISMEIKEVDYIVPALGVVRNTITLWTGSDGDGKTMLAQAMAVAVARGDQFLGMACQQSPVLYLDFENPAHEVQSRLRSMTGAAEEIPNLKVWGTWLEQQPPMAGSEILFRIAKETKPVIVVDPFRYFHDAEENDSTEMAQVMKYLRRLAACGSSVVLLHHPAKSEGSTGRGSSAIRGASDLAFLHALDKESSLITLKVDKNRFGASRTIVIRADFEEAKFEVTDAPWISSRNEKLSKLEQIIFEHPGISTQQLCNQAGGMKTRILKLLDEGRGTLWTVKKGLRGAKCFYSARSTCSLFSPKGREQENRSNSALTCSRTPENTLEHENRSEAESLCSIHGWHSDWSKPNGMKLCLKCHPVGTTTKEVDGGTKMPVLLS